MQFGRILDTQLSKTFHPVTAKPARTMHLLCDGGSRPNPGMSLPLVHDGRTFLDVPACFGVGNHRAVYESIDFALEHAFQEDATDLVISCPANLVWHQIARGETLDRLSGRRASTMLSANRFNSVLWQLIGPPFLIPGRRSVGTRKTLRRVAERERYRAA